MLPSWKIVGMWDTMDKGKLFARTMAPKMLHRLQLCILNINYISKTVEYSSRVVAAGSVVCLACPELVLDQNDYLLRNEITLLLVIFGTSTTNILIRIPSKLF